MLRFLLLSLTFLSGCLCDTTATAQQSKGSDRPAVIAYVAGYNGRIDGATIEGASLTHINYAFVNIRNGKAWLEQPAVDSANFVTLRSLKKVQPNLKLLISIGGWSWSKHFSDVALTDSSRRLFAGSAAAIVAAHKLDGIDIDWEYPGMRGDNNTYRPEDKQNFTELLAALRRSLDNLQIVTGKKYLLTVATGGFTAFLDHTEMRKAQAYLDLVSLMTYDYSWGKAGHHANLYAPAGAENSAAGAVKAYIAAGVPASKIVIGIAFYGRGGIAASGERNGMGSAIEKAKESGGFSFIKDSLVNSKGYVRHWDSTAGAPYLFNRDTRHFISYDDETSVALKCRFVKDSGLAGVIFWEYSLDPKRYLLRAITRAFSEKK